MLSVKHTNVAGTFYPGDPEMLENMLRKYIHSTQSLKRDKRELKGLIVPHAGYVYSGPVAGIAYAHLAQKASDVGTIAILSPTHYYYLSEIAVPDCSAFETPLGPIAVDESLVHCLLEKELVIKRPGVFEQEHALEVHLPFMKQAAPYAMLLPLIVGQTDPESVRKVVEELIRQDAFIIISSDLSHFHSYNEARQIDRKTQNCIESLDYQNLNGEMACGFHPLSGLLKWAAENGGSIETLDLRNSGDTAGDKSRVVGYGSFALYV